MDKETVSFEVLSSGESNYTVSFERAFGKVSLRCECKAAIMRMMCKHRTGLLDGSTKLLANEGDEARLKEVLAWPEVVELNESREEIMAEVKQVGKEIARLKNRERDLKDQIAELVC